MSSSHSGLGSVLRNLIASFDNGVQAVYDELGADFRPRFYPIACALLEGSPVGVSALATNLGMTQPAVSQTLVEMARTGLIDWSHDADRRRRLVTLSDTGKAVCRKIERVWTAVDAAVDSLRQEVGVDLPSSAALSLAALRRKSFDQRIREHMK